MDQAQLADVLDFAVDAARQAGAITQQYFNTDTPVEIKSDHTPVTIADRKAEEDLRGRIERRFPGHGIIGEEFGETPGREPGRWILDPIDGTFSFICGVPLYSNLIGFEWEGRMVVGVINLPAIDAIVYAASGLGCRWNDQPVRVSEVAALPEARLSTTSIKLMVAQQRYGAYSRLRALCAADRGWPDAYGYALLAAGRVDIVLDSIMSLWDTAALMPVVTEAGGTLTDWSGEATHTAPEVLATNGPLLRPVLDVLHDDGGST